LVSLVVLAIALPCFGDTVTYEYDDLYRLRKATYADGTVIEYTYDAAGNRLAKVVEPSDSDGDGLPDALEATTCTDPNNPDTDNDGIQDGVEDANANGVVDAAETDPCNADTDEDEMPDGWEVQYGLDPLTNDAGGDLDGDGITNLEEYNQGTDPTVASPTVTISADPETIYEGQSSTLTWSSTDTDSCEIQPEIGGGNPLPSNGSETVSPTATTTYTITATGSGGTAFDSVMVTVSAGGGQLGVTVQKAPGEPLGGINTYLFTASGSYLGLSQVTDANGAVAFEVPEGAYKVRADYLGYQFWSDEAQVTGDTQIVLTIPHQLVEITVQGSFQGTTDPFAGVAVYLFTAAGSYLNQNLQTDANGQVTFDLPEKAYKVRADYLGQQYWSGEFVWQDTVVSIPMADAEITVTGSGFPQEGVKVYVSSASGSYLGLNQTTDANGQVSFHLPATTYKFRVDYQESQYWSAEETLTPDQTNPLSISVGGGVFTVTVLTGPAEPLVGVKCYAFTEAGSYLGMFEETDNNGIVSFDLGNGAYKFRIDYLGYQFWSDVVTIPDVSSVEVMINEEVVEVTVTTVSGPAEGVRVYLFTESSTYLGLNQQTDAAGKVSFDLPVGKNYKFRADILGSQYWSEVITVTSGGVNSVALAAGGGQMQVTVQKAPGVPLAGINTYLFTASGSYLGLSQVTDANGVATFAVPEGTYKVRADYLGYQFWGDEAQVTGNTEIVLTIAHQSVEITVQGSFQGASEPFAGVAVYLFTAAGSYLGQNLQTDANGKVTFDLPEQSYKVRADYLGQQYWSGEFVWQDTVVAIPMADAEITVTGGGFPQEGVPIYVFSASGSYLGLNQATDVDGQVSFHLPANSYKFRVDYQGSQYWSAEETLTPDQTNPISISVGE